MRDAFYRMEVKMISRGDGRSLVGAAAYRNGLAMFDDRTGTHFDYGRKERIDLTEIRVPAGAPVWASDPHQLNNSIEAYEKRRDAQASRDILINLPHELTLEHGLKAVREFSDDEFTSRGFVVQLSSHGFREDPVTGRRNWHVHLLISTRRLIDGRWEAVKDRSLNSLKQLYRWRRRMAEILNAALLAAGEALRVQYLSAERRGVASSPIHSDYGIWRRAAKAAEEARQTALRTLVERAISPTAPANDRAVLQQSQIGGDSDAAGVRSALLRSVRSAVGVGVERVMSSVAHVHAHFDALEELKRKAAQDEADKARGLEAWQEQDREVQARREREDLLFRLRDELYIQARGREPRLAYARAWQAAQERAILLEGKTVDEYGQEVDRTAMRELIRAGGTESDVYAMAGLSPTARLLSSDLARANHCGRVIDEVTKEPEMASLLVGNNRASLPLYREADAKFFREPRSKEIAPEVPAMAPAIARRREARGR